MPVYAGKVNAPEFPVGLDWLNTTRPLTMGELRGKMVLLDFWTYCCINCLHIIPDLKRLERKYRDELVVVGVHSAKFTNERSTENIRDAVLRYDVEHPVLNDRDAALWDAYGVRAWPSCMLVDPAGKVVAAHSGENVFEALDPVIGDIIRDFDGRGAINRRPLDLVTDRTVPPDTLFAYPGKVAADAAGVTLYVADSNHHRIVAVALAERLIAEVIGDGMPGFCDGRFAQARFNRPQGLVVDGALLYVADTGNHAIRALDLRGRTVTTLAGTGEQASGMARGGEGRSIPLNSPWDLVAVGRTLYVSMAGSHQIWTLDLDTLETRPYAGSGREDLMDGSLGSAMFAQPSGITYADEQLIVADSESSAIRTVGLDPDGTVSTLTGSGLFEFGDADGALDRARLQHPLGVLAHEGLIYVADSYNHKVKVIDPARGTCHTVVGTGEPGMSDGAADKAELNEPAGMAVAAGRIYIADTNNHAIRIYDTHLKELSTLQVVDAELQIPHPVEPEIPFGGRVVELDEQVVCRGMGSFLISLLLPKGYMLNMEAPFSVRLAVDDPSVVDVSANDAERTVYGPRGPIEIGAVFTEGTARATIDLVVWYCTIEQEKLCYSRQIRVLVPIRVVPGGEVDSITVAVPTE